MNIEFLEKVQEYSRLIKECEHELEHARSAKRRIGQTEIKKIYVCTKGEGDFQIPVSKDFVLKQIDYHIAVLEGRLLEYQKFIKNL